MCGKCQWRLLCGAPHRFNSYRLDRVGLEGELLERSGWFLYGLLLACCSCVFYMFGFHNYHTYEFIKNVSNANEIRDIVGEYYAKDF